MLGRWGSFNWFDPARALTESFHLRSYKMKWASKRSMPRRPPRSTCSRTAWRAIRRSRSFPADRGKSFVLGARELMRRRPESDIYNEFGPALVGLAADRLAHISKTVVFLMRSIATAHRYSAPRYGSEALISMELRLCPSFARPCNPCKASDTRGCSDVEVAGFTTPIRSTLPTTSSLASAGICSMYGIKGVARSSVSHLLSLY
jgi:hypothetical protein